VRADAPGDQLRRSSEAEHSFDFELHHASLQARMFVTIAKTLISSFLSLLRPVGTMKASIAIQLTGKRACRSSKLYPNITQRHSLASPNGNAFSFMQTEVFVGFHARLSYSKPYNPQSVALAY
jgi:hypothetical protein